MTTPSEQIASLVKELEISFEAYDVILVGDGSGVNEMGGWAVVAFDTFDPAVESFVGCLSKTTVNVMEFVGYLHVLGELTRRRIHMRTIWPQRVLIVSDSEITVKCGNGDYTPKANLPFWAALAVFRRDFTINFRHIQRNSIESAAWCDDVSRKARKLLENFFHPFENQS